MNSRVLLAMLAPALLHAQSAKKPDLTVEEYLQQRRAPAAAREALNSLYHSGMDSLAAGRYGDAIAAFETVRQREPFVDERVLRGIASAYLAENRGDEAMQFLRDRLAQYPKRLNILLLFAEVADKTGRSDLALETLRQTAAGDAWPAFAEGEIHRHIAQICEAHGDMDCAISSFRKAAEVQPANVAAEASLADALARGFRTEESTALYRQILGVDPNDGAALIGRLTELLDSNADLNLTALCARRALALMPDSAEAADSLGWILLKLGQAADAAAIYRKLADRDPANWEFQKRLAMALIGSGDSAAARVALNAALVNASPANRDEIQRLIGAVSEK